MATRVLLYAYPGMLPQGPWFSASWTSLFVDLANALVQGGHECTIVSARRFAPATQFLDARAQARFIDERELHQAVRDRCGGQTSPSALATLICGGPLDHAALEVVGRSVEKACEAFTPDLVITFSLPADYLRHVWPGVVVMSMEAATFSRAPFPFSIYLDHLGIYGRSATSRLLPDAAGRIASPEALAMASDLRAWTDRALEAETPFAQFDPRERFKATVLLPLQVSNWHSFDDQAPYRTQYEYLHDIVSRAPPDVGLVATEYNQWGEVLSDEGANQNLAYLRAAYPNLVTMSATRRYFSPSQYLVRNVDGVFTISSNVGYQALLLGRRLGTLSSTWLANVAHETSPEAFFASLASGTPPEDRLPFLAWYLERYAIPRALYVDPAFLGDYLERRLQAIRAGGDPIAQFVPLAPAGRLRAHWLEGEIRSKADRWEGTMQRHRRLELVAHIAEDRVMPAPSATPASASAAPRYILLNETGSIDGGLHFGCNVATQYIHEQLVSWGMVPHGCANDAAACRALEAMEGIEHVRLLVFNGEGSLHGNPGRCRDLMEFAGRMRSRGVACVLLNSVWQDNDATLGRLLAGFDLVSVRESRSHRAIQEWRPDARLVPDVCFAALDVPGNATPAPANPADDVAVIDSVSAATALALHDFAEFQRWPFFLMGRLHVAALVESPGAGYDVRGRAFPRVLHSTTDLAGRRGCVTGRFHGLVAALVAGVPAVAIASNTHKIEGLLEDLGLSQVALLGGDWLSQGHFRRREAVERQLAVWDAATVSRTREQVHAAAAAVARLFDEIRGLAGRS